MSTRQSAKWLSVARTPLGAGAAVLLLFVVLLAFLAPVLWGGKAAAVDMSALRQSPSAAHLLGTDSLGRDAFYRVLEVARTACIP
jgi:peptide/nickel transport system permease protein